MSDQAISRLIKIVSAIVVLLVGGGVWYFTLGRKPTIALSVPITDKTGAASLHAVGAGDVLLVSGAKATLYAVAGGAAKWSVAFATPAPAAAPAAPVAPAAAKAAATVAAAPSPAPSDDPPLKKLTVLSSGEKADQLLAKRSEKRFAKLRDWSAKLNAKKAALKTPLQIEAFNEEAKKYHAELAEARAEAASVQKQTAVAAPHGTMAAAAAADDEPAFARGFARFDSYFEKTGVIADGGAILLLHGAHARLLDHASGAVKKEVTLPGNFARVLRGAGCVYAVGASPDGARQVTRIATADGAVTSVKVAGPRGEGRFRMKEAGLPAEPAVQALRTELSAGGGALLRCDVRLVEKKISERTIATAADPSSALEEADKKATTGWGSDAAAYGKALAADSAREDNGGKERSDQSTYEVVLTRPLDPAIIEARATVHGHADVFSTRTLDLVTAGRTLLAFDHSNKKLWETTLAQPVADPGSARDDDGDDDTASLAQPCVEDAGRLYFFDTAFLTAFDLATGQPAWRVPAAGIRKVQLDGRGALYVSTGSGGFDPNELPLTLKLDAKSGKILWKVEKYQDCIVSGGQVYATRETRNSEDMVNATFDRSKAIECRWKLYKLSASAGAVQWEWFQTRRPHGIAADGRKVALLFADELQVIRSLAR